MKFIKSFIVFILYLPAMTVSAQTAQRYKDLVFKDITITKDLSYNPAADQKEKKAYLFDLYQPKDDHTTRRPLVIWMHGGGFKFGSKGAKGIQLWCNTFAQRGYVCVGLNYRLSKKNPIFHFDELLKASYYAVQDLKTAIAYFKNHATEYGIDPDKIILAGNSAGGIMALQAAYSSNAELAGMAKLPADTAALSKPQERMHVAAVINFWGAIFNPDWLKNERVPIVSVLGSNDGIVPPTHKAAPVFGGIAIHQKADSLHIPNDLKVFEGYSHELQKHFNPIFEGGKGTQQRWLQAGQFAADFIYKTVLK